MVKILPPRLTKIIFFGRKKVILKLLDYSFSVRTMYRSLPDRMQIIFVAGDLEHYVEYLSLFSVVAVYGKDEDVIELARRLFLYVCP